MEKLTSLFELGMDWDTYKKFQHRARLPADTKFFAKFLSDETEKHFLGDHPSIFLEVGYAYKGKVYVTGNIKVGDLPQRLEGKVTWKLKEEIFEGRLKFKPPVDRESLWKEYNYHIDLYKHYLDMGLKAIGLFYAILGAIFSFVLTKGIPRANVNLIAFSLCIPILMSLAFAWTFIRGANLSEQVRCTINIIKSQLKIERAPDVQILSELLRAFGYIFLLVGVIIIPFVIYLILTDYFPMEVDR
jgi:hypothetical protein